MLERQRAGIARAKAERKFKGRKPTARAKSDAIMQLHGQGIAAAEIAHRLEISRACTAYSRTHALRRKATVSSKSSRMKWRHRHNDITFSAVH
jgi:DNA invertase Pin-like site-specific DNA recombinase